MSIQILKQGIIQTSGTVNKNLIPDSWINVTSDLYGYAYRSFNVISGVTYTVQARGFISDAAMRSGTTLKVYFYKPGWSYCPVVLTINSVNEITMCSSFTASETTPLNVASYSFKAASTAGDPVTTIWYKAEEGAVPTVWVPNSADSTYIGENIGLSEGCINPSITSFTKTGQVIAKEFIEI